MPTAAPLLRGGLTPVPVIGYSVESFQFGTVAVESVEPFNLQAANVQVISVEPFTLIGFTLSTSVEPFYLGSHVYKESVEPFSLTGSDVGLYAPSTSPIVTVNAASGSTTVTVDQTTNVVVGSQVILNGQILVVQSKTISTITFVSSLVVDANIGTTVIIGGSSIAAPMYGWWQFDDGNPDSLSSYGSEK